MESVQPLALIILDGWGLGPDPKADAIATARTPYFDHLQTAYPHATLHTFGEHVGLPDGQMGNSEVGHLNLGAGRVVFQELVRINRAIKDGSLAGNPALIEAFNRAKNSGRPLHLLGLISDGGVHSHIDHLKALCTMAHAAGVPKVLIHGFMDGRDTDPKGGIGYIRDLEHHLQALPGIRIASLIGRYYAMDRDQRWSRIARAHQLLTRGNGVGFASAEEALAASYAQGVTDEFLEPCRIGLSDTLTENVIRPEDVVLFFNYRTDRPRQLLRALAIEAFPEVQIEPLPLHVYSMTRYDQRFDKVKVLLEKQDLGQTLGEEISKAGLTQLRIAETEKYAHVTYFFGGGREEPFPEKNAS
jgi:2,3-bisphosphoglycerate-independent phosphoglycerate mutase